MLSVNFTTRGYAIDSNIGNLQFNVERYSWDVVGGPQTAMIMAYGNEASLFNLAQKLRYGVTIGNKGEDVWWGYLDTVDILSGNTSLSVGLANMWNSIKVQYTSENISTLSAAGTASLSISTYGTKEIVVSGSDLDTSTAAGALRDRLVSFYSYPRVEHTIAEQGQRNYALMTCAGWWNTLNWRYWTNTGTADVATSTLMSDIVTDVGSMFAGSYVATASGISILETRDGSQRAGDELQKLLELGVSSGNRYMAKVLPNRKLYIEQEPSINANDFIWSPGKLVASKGYAVPLYKCPVGVWVRASSNYWGQIDSNILIDTGKFFVTEATYEVDIDKWTPSPRGSYQPGGIGL